MNYESSFGGDAITARSEDIYGSDVDLEAKKKRRNTIIGVVIAIALLIAAGVYFFGGDKDAAAGEGAQAGAGGTDSQAPAVTVIVPGSGSVERVINATGTLAARREMPIGIAGEGGQVIRVLVQPGDWVKTGQVLAIIDQDVQTQQARSLAAQIQVNQADAVLAQNELDRALQLVDRGFISKADVDRRRATRDAANARVEIARAQLREAQARNGRLNIRAPESGLVLERNVEPGQVVGAGTGVLFRMAARGEMELRAQMSEADLANLSVGVRAEVRPVGAGRTFTGQVWQLAPVINETSRQGIARIALGYDKALRPGGFASAAVISGSSQSPVLPESAVLSDDKGSYVYVVGKDNKVERRNVTTGTVTPRGIAIASGITGKERVVLYAGGFLNPGETVRPQMQGAKAG
ncbi:efflux transporter, RND family, MFP subunit [Blastomonas sp. RAC04]|uniref:efflux RND transporter periplasmic adaptor subunit n=1 Tax=Blastomonas sp. RAC04 TaxID=1842535 RepID=UPI00083DF230|nr:efflux RND transporter periplasmic adaptor subunit [Blastomonas sp. RAC04]AOG00627.1 efflux transporter, RND family, MFP subunit [Blastomonas sp. RAC04]